MSEAALEATVGIVLIGRNEGERLKRCIRSIPAGMPAVYVDSGSTDGSADFARSHEVVTVLLDTDQPFTAARARNAGWRALVAVNAGLDYVQFVDGDCELAPGWIAAAVTAMEADRQLGVVFGRRRERFPDRSIYNRMCDDEWATPAGEALSCGGDALFRIGPLREADGYSDELVAGEEPDLCLRLRQRGWRVRCLAEEMTLHDANILSFGSWWRRTKRAGFSYAAHVLKHGRNGIPQWRRQLLSILVWGALIPVLAVAGAALGAALGAARLAAAPILVLAGLYLIQWARIAARARSAGSPGDFAVRYAFFIVAGKFAELTGVLTCWANFVRRRENRLIEYKSAA